MTRTFNLLDQPWIRVMTVEGVVEDLSLLSVFHRLEQLSSIHGEIASQDVAVLRLLLAVCHRATGGPEDIDTWQDYWEDTTSLGTAAAGYLERYRDRFDLRSPTVPFMQVAGIHAASGKLSGLGSLIIDVPNGLPVFTTRSAEGLERISWAEAARWLVHVHAFDPSGIRSGAVGDPSVKGGKGYPIGPGWTGQVGVVIVEGQNLAQILLLNMVVGAEVTGMGDLQVDEDLPPWEREPDGPAGRAALRPTGPVACYTWQTRRVLLSGDDDGVTGLFLGNGDKLTPQNRQGVEPMTSWRYSEPQSKKAGSVVYMPRKLPMDRAFWRGLSAVVPQMSTHVAVKGRGEVQRFLAPGVVRFYQHLMSQGIVPMDSLVPLHAVGMEYGTQEAVVTQLVDDRLSLPSALLEPEDERLRTLVQDMMTETEQVARAVNALGRDLARAQGAEPDRVGAAGERAGSRFYLEIDEEFPRWLASLSAAADVSSARERWRSLLRSRAWHVGEDLAGAVPPTALAGRGGGKARMDAGKALMYFRMALRRALPDDDVGPLDDQTEETHPSAMEDRND